MESGFTIILLILVLLFYLSNPRNKINRWCALAGMLFWLGIAKEAILYNVIPFLHTISDVGFLEDCFMPIYSICTWALYSLAMPTTIVFALYFCSMDQVNPKRLRTLKPLLYIPALILSCFFPPLNFRTYQLNSQPFWYAYAIYNLGYGIMFALLMIKGVRKDDSEKAKRQKKQVRMIILPPVIFWVTSVFLTHPFGFSKLFKLWQINAMLLLICVVSFVFMAFHDGFMGLKLSGETFRWDSDMGIINTGVEYISHMLKNQTAKMNMCIEHLKAQYTNDSDEVPEELAIMSRSIATLKSYMDKIKRHSQDICLFEQPCRLKEILEDSIPLYLKEPQSPITVCINVPDTVFWICDKNHISEVFANIIMNATEAIRENGKIEIYNSFDKTERYYLLHIKDDGIGMTDDEVKNMFNPYFTTKSTEKNFGLGLSYCKNVLHKHGGGISAKSPLGNGTIITVAFPSKRVAIGSEEMSNRNA